MTNRRIKKNIITVTNQNGKRFAKQIVRPDASYEKAKASKVKAADVRKLDNLINKANKRMIALARNGGYSSEAYKAMRESYEAIIYKVRIEQAMGTGKYKTEKEAELHLGQFASPVEYASFTEEYKDENGNWQTGSTYNLVPQLLRNKWVMGAVSVKDIKDLLEIQTAQAEETALEVLLPNREDISDRVGVVSETATKERIEDIRLSNEEHSDMLTDVWHYLYTLRDKYDEVYNFIKACEGTTGTAAVHANNGAAIKMFNKYTGSVLENLPRERALTKEEVQNQKMRMQAIQLKYYQTADEKQKRALARTYLETANMVGTYDDGNPLHDVGWSVTHFPTEPEIDDLIKEWSVMK